MYVHFAFGKLGKLGKTEEQTNAVINHILSVKRLLVSECTEFIPILPTPGAKRIPLEKSQIVNDQSGIESLSTKINLADFHKLPDHDEISYLPDLVAMICFIKISFNQLKASSHSTEYGKFGLVFKNDFLRVKGIKQVNYYTEESIWADPLIKQRKALNHQKEPEKKKELDRKILSYRKPATYFPSFAKQKMKKISYHAN